MLISSRLPAQRPRHAGRMQLARAADAVHPLAPAVPPIPAYKADLVHRLLSAKKVSGKSFTQIAAEVGLTNVYTTQLFYRQQALSTGAASKLRAAVPDISDQDLREMQSAPARRFDAALIQDPVVYRLHEAIMHGGDSIKALINEEFGDGIMSAIGFYATVERGVGKDGEPRVILTFNGKFLPYTEQIAANNIYTRPE